VAEPVPRLIHAGLAVLRGDLGAAVRGYRAAAAGFDAIDMTGAARRAAADRRTRSVTPDSTSWVIVMRRGAHDRRDPLGVLDAASRSPGGEMLAMSTSSIQAEKAAARRGARV